MVKQSTTKKRRGRPKGSKNRVKKPIKLEAIPVTLSDSDRYTLRSRIEKDALDTDQTYYFIYDLNRGAIYPEIIARFTVETEAKLCVEFLNGTRKISRKEYNKKRVCVL